MIASELVVPGYPPRDLLDRPAFLRAIDEANRRIVAEVPEGVVLVFGTVVRNEEARGKPLFNAAIAARRGQIVAVAKKRLLPSYDVFDEERFFEPGHEAASFELNGERIALTICEDAWNDDPSKLVQAGAPPSASDRVRYADNPIADALKTPARLLVNLSASPFTLSKMRARPSLFADIAKRHGVAVAFVNQVGGNDELLFDGRSTLYGPDGSILARAAAFAEDLVIADIEKSGPIRPDLEGEEQAAYDALVMGVRDYVRKCGFSRVVLGLSGGIDSALVATIAADALGPENVLGIAMPTRYSSEGSRKDAQDLARNLGIRFREHSIEPIFESYLQSLVPVLDELAAPREGDVTAENLQARIRGAVLMAISNRTGALLLNTSNKSEAAVGYATLYGDMCGALSVLSDVYKTMVYRLAHWVNRHGERIPHASIVKAPSAELRPNQTDQDSLPPYDLLDEILELYVEDGLSRDEIAQKTGAPAIVDKVIRLVHVSEYKRRQAAPGLFLTKKAFGIGRRMPIAQGFRG